MDVAGTGNLGESDVASLLRRAADDELNPGERATLDAHLKAHPEDAQRIEFERRLRAACGRVMSRVTTPAKLGRHVQGAVALERRQREGLFMAQTRRRSFWAGARRAMSVAALLAIGALASFMFQQVPLGGHAEAYDLRLAGFVNAEHARCCTNSGYSHRKFAVADLSEVPDAFAELLGSRPEVTGLEGTNIEFAGAGRCAVPGRGASIHMLFRVPDPDGGEPVEASIFVQEDLGDLDLADGVTYVIEGGASARNLPIYVWKRGGLVHYLLSDEKDACDRLCRALGVPEPTERL